MKVIVTGSNGLLGGAVATRLHHAGHDVLGIDFQQGQKPPPWRHVTADLTDIGMTLQLVRDADALVHIAGVPRPVGLPPSVVFQTNVGMTYNVTEAAALARFERIVYASSMSVLGYPFFERRIAPGYVPIDSAHPIEAQDAYGLSKWLGEEIIDAATRRTGMSAVSLRLPWIQTQEGFLANVEARRARAIATPCDLWGYVDTRDAAEAFKLSLEAKIDGHARLFISAPDTFMIEETDTLLATAYPDTARRSTMSGHQSIFELDEAKTVLGFEAHHSWRDY